MRLRSNPRILLRCELCSFETERGRQRDIVSMCTHRNSHSENTVDYTVYKILPPPVKKRERKKNKVNEFKKKVVCKVFAQVCSVFTNVFLSLSDH